VESPSLEIFQPRLDAVLCSLLWVTLLGQGVGLGDPRGPCQPLLFCDSVMLWLPGGSGGCPGARPQLAVPRAQSQGFPQAAKPGLLKA